MDNRRSTKNTQRFRHISLWVITPAKTAEAYYNINTYQLGVIMTFHQIPPRLKRKLDADYGTDGWTFLGYDENLYIDIKFYLTGAIISFNRDHWL